MSPRDLANHILFHKSIEERRGSWEPNNGFQLLPGDVSLLMSCESVSSMTDGRGDSMIPTQVLADLTRSAFIAPQGLDQVSEENRIDMCYYSDRKHPLEWDVFIPGHRRPIPFFVQPPWPGEMKQPEH